MCNVACVDWYIVVKTINGHRYRYRQKTWREGGHVRTRSEYIGPAGDGYVSVPRIPASATTLPIPFSPRPPTIDALHVDAALKNLMDEKAPAVSWHTPWNEKYSGKLLVTRQDHIEETLLRLQVKRTFESRGAYYRPSEDVVNIPPMEMFTDEPFESATYSYYSTLLHELVHWTKDEARTGRTRDPSPRGYAREELVAELGAAILMQYFGLEPGDLRMHTNYFQGWLKRAGAKRAALIHAQTEAERAVRYILSHGIIST